MNGPRRLGFQRGQSSYNTVLAAMYLCVIVLIAGVVIAMVIMPAISSTAQPSGGDNGGDVVATTTPTNSHNRGSVPPRTQSPSPASTTKDLTQAGSRTISTSGNFKENFKQHIERNRNITIISINVQEGVVHVEWIPHDMTTRAVTEDTAFIVGTYDGLVKKGWDVEKLNGTVLNTDQQSQATFHVKTQWVRQRQRGDISKKEVITRTMDTMNTTQTSIFR